MHARVAPRPRVIQRIISCQTRLIANHKRPARQRLRTRPPRRQNDNAKPRTQKRSRTEQRPNGLMLPTLIVDDMMVLPNLTIPFPVEDEEAAYVFERACRASKRLVFLVCERPIELPDQTVEGIAADPSRIKEFFATFEQDPRRSRCQRLGRRAAQWGLRRLRDLPSRDHRRSRPVWACESRPAGHAAGHLARHRAAGRPGRADDGLRGCRPQGPDPGEVAQRSGDDRGDRAGRELHQHASERARKKC